VEVGLEVEVIDFDSRLQSYIAASLRIGDVSVAPFPRVDIRSELIMSTEQEGARSWKQ
jgi:hypothetical protein